MKLWKSIWRFILESLEALAADDRERKSTQQRDKDDAQKRWLSYLGSPKP